MDGRFDKNNTSLSTEDRKLGRMKTEKRKRLLHLNSEAFGGGTFQLTHGGREIHYLDQEDDRNKSDFDDKSDSEPSGSGMINKETGSTTDSVTVTLVGLNQGAIRRTRQTS